MWKLKQTKRSRKPPREKALQQYQFVMCVSTAIQGIPAGEAISVGEYVAYSGDCALNAPPADEATLNCNFKERISDELAGSLLGRFSYSKES